MSVGAIQELNNKLDSAIVGNIRIDRDSDTLITCIETKFLEISEQLYTSVNNKIYNLEANITPLQDNYNASVEYNYTLDSNLIYIQTQLDETVNRLNNTIDELNSIKELLNQNTKSKGWCEWFFS